MKKVTAKTSAPTLQDVLDRLAADHVLSPNRRRDLRSAVTAFAKLKGLAPAKIELDLAQIRETLDSSAPAQAQVSSKRWSNLRSDLAAAIDASGLVAMLKTAGVEPSEKWVRLLDPAISLRVRYGLSRFAHWASLRGVDPERVDDAAIARFIDELKSSSLVRNIDGQHALVVAAWNRLVALCPDAGLRSVSVPTNGASNARVPWETLPVSFRNDVEQYLAWGARPDPLDENARARELAPKTLRLRREQIHSAVDAAVSAGIPIGQLTSFATLIEPATFTTLLRHRWQQDGRELTAYTHGVAGTLIAIASESLKLPLESIATLKGLRAKLGALPGGMTEKNRSLLRKFDEPRLQQALVRLPDKLWHAAKRGLATSTRPFITLQTALALDILTHAPMRMENLSMLEFERRIQWPQGRGKPALILLPAIELKNKKAHEVELPRALSDRLWLYRNEIIPKVTGARPTAVFVTWGGTPRCQATITLSIEKAVLKHLGVKLTPHQFRHIAAKIILDANPGAYELVRQVLGQVHIKTTTNFYAGVDTRRAGRAHAALLDKLRNDDVPGRPRPQR
jgi:integrase